MDIKELSPLEFMPYMARLFRDITGIDLRGLGDYTGWMGLGGYYHWKLAQLGQLSASPDSPPIQCLRDPWTGLADGRTHEGSPKLDNQLLSPLDEAGVLMSPAGTGPPLTEVGDLLDEVENQPPLDEAGNLQPRDLLLHCPQGQKEVAMVSPGTRGQ